MNNIRNPIAVWNVSVQEEDREKQRLKVRDVADEVFCEGVCRLKSLAERDEGSWSRKRVIKVETALRAVESNREMLTIDLSPVVNSALVIGGNLHRISQ
jgi:hypothetical protein